MTDVGSDKSVRDLWQPIFTGLAEALGLNAAALVDVTDVGLGCRPADPRRKTSVVPS